MLQNLRRKAAQVLFVAVLLWPPIHAVASKVMGFSSWRLFGWGMYASPHPSSLSSLNLILLPNPLSSPIEYEKLHREFRKKWGTLPESSCLYVFQGGKELSKQADTDDFCTSERFVDDLEYFRHFGSQQHLASLADGVQSAFSQSTDLDRSSDDALRQGQLDDHGSQTVVAIHIRQRVDVASGRSYIESRAYEITDHHVTYIGKIDDPR